MISNLSAATLKLHRLSIALILLLLASYSSAQEDSLSLSGKPNILLIVADDLGYTDIGAYGGEIKTPYLDKLASQSLKFSNFHTMPTCAPTRSILLTGADNHQVGLGAQQGAFTKKQKGHPGYEGYLNDRAATLPEVLGLSGYRTYMSGKWHLGYEAEQAPFFRGFQETFALIPSGASHFADQIPLHGQETVVYRRNGKLVEELPDDFYSSKNYTDSLLSWIERDQNVDQPFFAYLAYTAPHDPLQAPRSYIDKYKGVYDEGYEVLREKRFKKLKENGLISQNQPFPDWPALVPRWSDLSQDEKAISKRDMETLAAMVDYLDGQIGRVYEWLENNNELDNTIIIFMSDNGAAGLDSKKIYPSFDDSQFNNELENRGMINSFTNLDPGWAVASTAIYRDFKGFTSEGGIRSPLFIKHTNQSEGNVSHSFLHVKDLMPTILEAAGAPHPGNSDVQMSGKSILPIIKDPQVNIHENEGIGFELHGTRAFIQDGWKIIQSPMPLGTGEWRLYNLTKDPTELNNLIRQKPDKFKDLLKGYQNYERHVGVIYDFPGPLGLFNNIYKINLGLIILIFLMAIVGKLSGRLKEKYIKWGYSTVFMYSLAVLESIGILGLFTHYNRISASFLLVIMLGAFYTLIKNKENWKSYVLPLSTTVALGIFLLLKSGRLVTLFY